MLIGRFRQAHGSASMVYFTQNTKTQAIKIGYSKNPKQRRSGLQTASEDDLAVLGLAPSPPINRTNPLRFLP
jgi:hypothetical protein